MELNSPQGVIEIEGPVVLGEISYLDKLPRTLTVKAINQLSILILRGECLDKLFKTIPQTGHRLKHNIAISVIQTIRKMNTQLEEEIKENQILSLKAAELESQKYQNSYISKLAINLYRSC